MIQKVKAIQHLYAKILHIAFLLQKYAPFRWFSENIIYHVHTFTLLIKISVYRILRFMIPDLECEF